MTTIRDKQVLRLSKGAGLAIAEFAIRAISWITMAFTLWVLVYYLTLMGLRFFQ